MKTPDNTKDATIKRLATHRRYDLQRLLDDCTKYREIVSNKKLDSDSEGFKSWCRRVIRLAKDPNWKVRKHLNFENIAKPLLRYSMVSISVHPDFPKNS